MEFDRIIVDVTSRCNLSCPVCYRKTAGAGEDMPFTRLQALEASCRGIVVSLCGGEPTLRDDLPGIIKLFNRRNRVFLVTNGVRLAVEEYAAMLRESGLEYISFSLNGFSAATYERINGAPLLALKRKALGNMKKLGFKLLLSVLIVKGVNEREVPDIINYCVENRDFIREVRIRGMARFGRHLDAQPYTVAELRDMVAGRMRFDRRDIEAECGLRTRLSRAFSFALASPECSLDFHVKKRAGSFVPCGKGVRGGNGARMGGFADAVRAYGLPALFASACRLAGRRNIPWLHSRDHLKIGLRSWPESLTSPALARCRTGYFSGGEVAPFCLARIREREGCGGP